MTFRHPLRNEWDAMQPRFAQAAKKPGVDGVVARAMLDLMPPLLTVIERERDNATPPLEKLTALLAVAGAILENAIESAYPEQRKRRAALDHVLRRLSDSLAQNLMKPTGAGGGLILPGLGG